MSAGAAKGAAQPAIARRTAVLVGIAGSTSAFCLSLYDLKAFAYADPEIRAAWDVQVIQHPMIHAAERNRVVRRLADAIAARRPQLVAFSCYMWNAVALRALAALLRRALPEARLVWGGPEIATDFLLEGKFDDLEADFCISGEGELTFRELLRVLVEEAPRFASIAGLSFRGAGAGPFTVNPKRAPFRSLLEIPSPYLSGVVDDEVLLRPGVEANLEMQRGCTLRCSYCIYHKDMDRISYSDVDRMVDEVAFLIDKGVTRFRFVDANFASSLDHAKAVMRALVARRFQMKVMFELIPGFLDEELAALFAELNSLYAWNEVTLGVGVQTTNVDILRSVRRPIRTEKFEETFALLQKYDVYAKIDLIVGLPGEDVASIERTLEYMLERLRGSRSHLLCCHVMRGLPGTELLEIAKRERMVFTSKYAPHELFESPVLPRADMLRCLRRTAVVFRLVNHEGWANREFGGELVPGGASVREAFFDARDRLGVSNVGLVDRIVEGMLELLAPRKSSFAAPDFPHAEMWWWNQAKKEVPTEWLLGFLGALAPRGASREGALAAEAFHVRTASS
jgi:radical SAM superfamily enzyme YgiQ (UPF0313 family)